MPSNYPTALDDDTSMPDRITGDAIPASDSDDKKEAIIQLETKLGTGADTPASGEFLKGGAAGASSWAAATKSDVGLGNVDNTSDSTKNSAAVTLTNKTLTAPVINSPTGIAKGDVGLGNVDNTSDANKPISTATQTALDGKVNDTGDETIAGVKTFSSDPLIPDEAYDATGWNGSLEPPTKNAVRDKIESMGAGGGGTVDAVVAGNNIDVDATDPANPIISVETLTLADVSDVTSSAAELNVLDGIPAGLTATELGYVDGVTSAIQTQLDGKQASGATLTSLEGLSLVGGDVLYATAADTLARLAKGTAAQVLTMNSGATAPEWAAAGGSSPIFGRWYRSSDVSLPNADNGDIVFNSQEVAPSSGSFNTSTGTFTAGTAGFYMVALNLHVSSSSVRLDLTAICTGTGVRNPRIQNALTGGAFSYSPSVILYLPASGTMVISCYSGGANTLQGGGTTTDDASTLTIYKVN